MKHKRTKQNLVLLLLVSSTTMFSQEAYINLADAGTGCIPTASSFSVNESFKAISNNPEEAWCANNEASGAWINLEFKQSVPVREIWILSQPLPRSRYYPYRLQYTYNYQPARNITISFSDGSAVAAELRRYGNYQIISIPGGKNTFFVRITINDVWPGEGSGGTGIGKIKVYSKAHEAGFTIRTREFYDAKDNRPVKMSELEIINPGKDLHEVHLVFSKNNRLVDDIPVGSIDANCVKSEKIWTLVPENDGEYKLELFSGKRLVAGPVPLNLTTYRKTWFEGGRFLIHNTNHNDLGFLFTQYETANFRSRELILPAMKIMETSPEFKYTMESVEYLKEFFARHPEKRDEMERLIRERRFSWGGSYIQMLQVHVGPEKMVRQFYYGRRWLIENIPGGDTRIYMNADVPQFTYQLPQVLKKSGIDYLIQGRIPLGFYYWQGLDGTLIPVYGIRYHNSELLNPRIKTEWLPFAFRKEDYYRSHSLPGIMIYDFNEDYLPPMPEFIPYVKEQNESFANFAAAWNSKYSEQKEKQVDPPVLEFANPEDMLDDVFSDPRIKIETIKGDWPFSWAYYDEPGNREALLDGRRAHNLLLTAEKIFSSLTRTDPSVIYPKAGFDSAWMANCWHDHGWGGSKGLPAMQSDSVFHSVYKKSHVLAQSLLQEALQALADKIPAGSADRVPVMVYNSLNWIRTGHVRCAFTLPAGWKGFTVKNNRKELVPFEVLNHESRRYEIIFIAGDVPATGYTTYYIEPDRTIQSPVKTLSGDSIDTEKFKIAFGNSGIKEYTDKINGRTYFKTDKFGAGEVLQFTAPGSAWEMSSVDVIMEDFDRSGNYESKLIRFSETPVRYIRETETRMQRFILRQRIMIYKNSGDIELEADIINWDGTRNKELRIAFPFDPEIKTSGAPADIPRGESSETPCKTTVNPAITYEIPFGARDYVKDDVDFSQWPDNRESQFNPERYGATANIPYREAINWVDVSAGTYKGYGCLFASDMTLHLFEDQTSDPVSYPVVQHVLLSSRKSLGGNPDYWFRQKGDHSYRMALFFHDGNWRMRYRDGIAFNYPLLGIVVSGENTVNPIPSSQSFLSATPSNIIITTMKQSENGKGTVIRFYEAEGKKCTATLKTSKPVQKAYLTNILEYDPVELSVNTDGTVSIPLSPWEIVTIMIE